MKTNWQQLALFLVGLIVGGGAAAATAQYQLAALRQAVQDQLDDVEEEAKLEREKLHIRIDTYEDMTTQILVGVAELSSRVETLTQEIARLREHHER